MNSKGKELVKGVVTESLPDCQFRVRLEDNREILAYLAGKLRIYHIKILPGDKVIVQLSSYDKKRGRIIRRI